MPRREDGPQTFAHVLRQHRRRLRLTQAELAGKIGVSNTYISALESGRKQAPPRALVEALAASLDVPAATLWQTARAEREEHLRSRINGVPTSRRVSRDAGKSDAGDQETDDAYLDKVLRPLKESLRKTDHPEKVVRALKALADSLGDGGN